MRGLVKRSKKDDDVMVVDVSRRGETERRERRPTASRGTVTESYGGGMMVKIFWSGVGG